MGQNLVLNMERNGYQCGCTTGPPRLPTSSWRAEGNIVSAYDMQALADAVETPRRVLLMVKAERRSMR